MSTHEIRRYACAAQETADGGEESPRQEMIQESGSVVTSGGGHTIHCLTIIGQIEGHTALPSQNKTTKYEHLIPQLVAVEEEP